MVQRSYIVTIEAEYAPDWGLDVWEVRDALEGSLPDEANADVSVQQLTAKGKRAVLAAVRPDGTTEDVA
jgi:hypothetical protein